MQDVKQIINHLKEQAQKSMRRNGGDLEPKMYFLTLYPGQKTPVYFPVPCSRFFGVDRMKAQMPVYSALCWEKKKRESPPGIELIAVCLISDTWQASVDISGKSQTEINDILDNSPRPSNMPNKREAIAMAVCFKDNNEVYLMYYKRVGKRIEYEEAISTMNYKGIMSELYPKGDVSALFDTVLNYFPELKY